MHVHILGVCGTFMGGIAAIAKAAGHRVTGSDRNVYPPMSTQLEALGVELVEGFEASQLNPAPDVVIVGNVMSRGHPVIEALLESNLPFASGPEWLAREVLRDRWVLAVAGTHGKTTTSSMLAWIMEYAGLSPGFLIGGIPQDFGVSARLGEQPFFVIEADEYDTAFFDKRSKFVHYRPRTAILNNLEYDHADIFPDVEAIERQFHHLVRTIPASGLIVHHRSDPHLAKVLAMGCWSTREAFAREPVAAASGWSARLAAGHEDGSAFEVLCDGAPVGRIEWSLIGGHNVDNALAAIAQIAPLLGLLGTLLGMVKTFWLFNQGGNYATPVVLAGGMYMISHQVGVGYPVEAHIEIDQIHLLATENINGFIAAVGLQIARPADKPTQVFEVLVAILND